MKLLVARTSVNPQLGKIVEEKIYLFQMIGRVTSESFNNGDKDHFDGKKR